MKTPTNAISVSGLGYDGVAPSVAVAVSRAQGIACRSNAEGSVYVRAAGETVVRVDREGFGREFSVTTIRVA